MAEKVIAEKTEDEKVAEWRCFVMEKAGIGIKTRLILSSLDVDLHKIVAVKEAGCDDKLLLEIFS